METEITVRYLPLFERDLTETAQYISHKLNNPLAAITLIDDIEKAIIERSHNPKAFEPYRSAKPRLHQYYPIYVRNYTVYYVVIDNVMEVRRLLYSPRNTDMLL